MPFTGNFVELMRAQQLGKPIPPTALNPAVPAAVGRHPAKAARLLRGRHRLALSGTSIENLPRELSI